MHQSKKLLLISHSAMLTGAPILFLNLLKLLKLENDFTIRIVIKDRRKHELLPEFSKIGETLLWEEYEAPSLLQKISTRLFPSIKKSSKPGTRKNDEKIQNWINDTDFVISNTITNGDFLQCFTLNDQSKLITYVHELEIACKTYTAQEYLDTVKKKTSLFLVPCKAVATHLTENIGISKDKINFLNYYIPFNHNVDLAKKKVKQKFIVGIAGSIDWRKGADIFPLIVASFFNTFPGADVVFVWQGADKTHIEYSRTLYELIKIGLADKVLLEPPSKDMFSFYESIDVFLLISKEDPYPLVVLEAASHKKPCICFDGAGGAPEFVQEDAGKVIPFLDITNMVKAINTYYTNTDLCIQHGENAYQKYQRLHNTKELILSQFRSALT